MFWWTKLVDLINNGTLLYVLYSIAVKCENFSGCSRPVNYITVYNNIYQQPKYCKIKLVKLKFNAVKILSLQVIFSCPLCYIDNMQSRSCLNGVIIRWLQINYLLAPLILMSLNKNHKKFISMATPAKLYETTFS